jgi:MscS family membrane protein
MEAKMFLRTTITIILILNLFFPAFGQTQAEQKITINASETLIASESVKPVEENRLRNPRETVRLFMNVMNDVSQGKTEDINKALSALYTDDLPAETKDTQAAELATKLFKVLNNFTFKIDSIPEKPKGKKYQLKVGTELGIKIVLYRYSEDTWKFNYTHTLSKVDTFLAAIEKNKEAEGKEDSTIDPVLKSPRDTFNVFFTAIGNLEKGGLPDAIKTLDLSRFEKTILEDIGQERVTMLISVINRYKYVELVELPNDPKGPPYVLLQHKAGRIVVERVKLPDSNIEAWKFSAQTVADLPALYDAFKDKPLVKGISKKIEVPLAVRLRDYMKANFPGLLNKSFFLENWQWLGMFCIIFLGMGVSRLITNLLKGSIQLIFKREALKIDLSAEARFIKPINIALTTWAWWLGLTALALPGDIRAVLLITVKVITGIAGIWAGYRLMDVIGNYLQAKAELTENKFDDLLVPLATRSLKVFSIAIGLVFIADIFSLDIDKILAGLGIGGLAFALAAKDTISNVFGSITILVDRPFQIGDWVTIGSADGTVESVGVRSTRIRTFYNSLISIPNSQLITATIDNWGARKYRRINCKLGVAYDTPPEKIDAFCEGIREIIRKHPYTRKDYFHCYLNEFDAASLNILLYCFVETPDWSTELREKHRLFSDIIKLAQTLQVEFAFPTQTLYLRNEETPVHKNIPENQKAAWEKGSKEAQQIVAQELGDPARRPPPVTF